MLNIMPHVLISENSDHGTILSNTEQKQSSSFIKCFFYSFNKTFNIIYSLMHILYEMYICVKKYFNFLLSTIYHILIIPFFSAPDTWLKLHESLSIGIRCSKSFSINHIIIAFTHNSVCQSKNKLGKSDNRKVLLN